VRQRSSRLVVLLVAVATILPAPLSSQTATPADSVPKVFKTNARIVVLDVVVTAKNHRPVLGLHKEDFLLSENGKPQTITYFEEHTGAEPQPAKQPDLPPNVFTNIPQVKPSDALTVLLLDSLNTPLTDQGRVRAQVIKYLKKPQPGQRMAIFTLGSQLRMVQGFTDDPALLAAAVNNKKNGTQASPLLQTNPEKGADQEIVSALAEQSAELASAMQQFLASQSSVRNDIRVKLTLNGFQQLAHFLAGIPGRKNVVWFSGAFPVAIFPNPDLPDSFGVQTDNQQQIKRTDALLASAQVALYPVAAEGVATDSIYSAGAETRLATKTQLARPQMEAQARNADHATMDVIAKETGGEAIYNTNGLSNAIDRATEHGSYFYTLTYTTTNVASDGQFRKIAVKLANGRGDLLAYRQGYYADDAKTVQATAAPIRKVSGDKLSPYLLPGRMASTQISLMLHIVRGAAPARVSTTTSSQGGDNPNLKGPLTRYSVDFMVPARGLQFDPDANGNHHVSLEAALVVYSHKGEPINWMFRQVNLNLDPARYKAAQTTGINLFFEIDAPAEAATLRSGVYDLNANLAGTLELPLSRVVNANATASAK
jgi:VWFA-related protein